MRQAGGGLAAAAVAAVGGRWRGRAGLRGSTADGWADTVAPGWADTSVLEAETPASDWADTVAPRWADTRPADDEDTPSPRQGDTDVLPGWRDLSEHGHAVTATATATATAMAVARQRGRFAAGAAAAAAAAGSAAAAASPVARAPAAASPGQRLPVAAPPVPVAAKPAAAATSDSPAPAAPVRAGSGAATPRVSVVIPTYRRPRLLLRCLSALARQTLPTAAFEIIVVDDGHSSNTRLVVQDFMQAHPALAVRYLRPAQGRGPAVARNAGWRAARAPLVAFTDDDTEPLTDWLEEGVRALADARFLAVAGRVLVPPPGDPAAPPTDHERMTRGLETAEFVTANAFVRTRALDAVQGFDERFARAWREDSDLQFRLLQHGGGGDVIGRARRAMVLHPVRAERWGISLRQQKNAFYDALLYRQHPQRFRERIHPQPPWNYFAIVLATLALPAFLLAGWWWVAAACAALVVGLVLAFARRRLAGTARTPAHVWEMLATSALIPYLSVYWRLRGAWHFRVAFL